MHAQTVLNTLGFYARCQSVESALLILYAHHSQFICYHESALTPGRAPQINFLQAPLVFTGLAPY